MIFEIIVIFAFGFGLRIIFINTSSADSAIQQYMVERLKANPFGDYTCNKSVIAGMYGYPSLHYYPLTKIPYRFRPKLTKLFNILIDSIMTCLVHMYFCIEIYQSTTESSDLFGILLYWDDYHI